MAHAASSDKRPEGTLSNSAARAIAVVEFLASSPHQTFTLSEISRQCSLSKSTAHTVLGILYEAGWLIRSPTNLEYGLGPTLIMVGRAAEEARPEVGLARPIMESLAISFQRECVLSTTIGEDMVILEIVGRMVHGGGTARPGRHVPLVAPFGTVFVAWQDREIRDAWYARSSINSTDQVNLLERVLDATVRRGFVVTLNSDPRAKMDEIVRAVSAERTIRDIRRILKEQLAQLPPIAYLVDDHMARHKIPVESIQAPIFDSQGVPRYSLTIGNIDLELEPDKVVEFGKQVRYAADQVTAALAINSKPNGVSRTRVGRFGPKTPRTR
jgi:DNA-binding IclR family transcriptional regulator